MTNQTFEEKLGQEILAYGVRRAMQNGRGSTTPAQDYRDAVQGIIKLIEEEVVKDDIPPVYDPDEGYCMNCDFQATDGSMDCICVYNNRLRAEMRKLIKGE